MSFDLSFLPQEGKAMPSADVLRKYFLRRAWYEVADTQCCYQNQDTGVYFTFDWSETRFSFNLNYYRPHIFGLEAQEELAALVRTFELRVDDPQSDGMGRGEYTKEGFLRSWNAGNRFACQAMQAAGRAPEGAAVLPSALIERYWRWNFGKTGLQERLGSEVFVPRILFFRLPDRIASFVAWGDAIPIALPVVDFLILVRKELSVGARQDENPDLALVPWSACEKLAVRKERLAEAGDGFLLRYDEAPPEVVAMFRSAEGMTDKPEGLAVGEILDAELVLPPRM